MSKFGKKGNFSGYFNILIERRDINRRDFEGQVMRDVLIKSREKIQFQWEFRLPTEQTPIPSPQHDQIKFVCVIIHAYIYEVNYTHI